MPLSDRQAYTGPGWDTGTRLQFFITRVGSPPGARPSIRPTPAAGPPNTGGAWPAVNFLSRAPEVGLGGGICGCDTMGSWANFGAPAPPWLMTATAVECFRQLGWADLEPRAAESLTGRVPAGRDAGG